MTRIAVVLASLTLAGCVSMAQRVSDARADCIAAGYQLDTPELAQCSIQGARTAAMAAHERSQRAGEALLQYSQQLRQQELQNRPQVTTCRQYGSQIQCVTN